MSQIGVTGLTCYGAYGELRLEQQLLCKRHSLVDYELRNGMTCLFLEEPVQIIGIQEHMSCDILARQVL
ncbi:hypothetical protein D3C77_787900 [compost metagenome]